MKLNFACNDSDAVTIHGHGDLLSAAAQGSDLLVQLIELGIRLAPGVGEAGAPAPAGATGPAV